MGKLYDSLKQRGSSGLPPATTAAAAAPRLQVISAPAEPAPADDHDPMPWYEVPNGDATPPATLTAPVLYSSGSRTRNLSVRKSTDQKWTFTQTAAPATTPASSIAREVVVVHEPEGERAVEYGHLAEQLAELMRETNARSLTLLPLEHSAPAGLLAANLGFAWAQRSRQPIVLIDAARSTPEQGLAALLGLGQAPGWEELMTGTPLAQTIQQTGRAWLDVIAAGRRLSLAKTQAWAKNSCAVLGTLRKHYRSVVLLSPAYPHSPLGLVLAESTDSTCLVVAADQVNHPQKDALLQALAQTSPRVLGTLVMDG